MKRLYILLVLLSYGGDCIAKDEFSLGFTEYRPYIWREKSEYKGIYVEILEEALHKRLNLPVKFLELPEKRVEQLIVRGGVDGFIRRESKERLVYSKTGRIPITIGIIGLFTYKDHPAISNLSKVETLGELKPYSILASPGDQWSKENLVGHYIDSQAKDLVQNLKKLSLKRGDIILEIEQVGQYNIKKLKLEEQVVQIPGIVLDPIFYHLYISSKSSHVNRLSDLDNVFKDMLNDGSMAKIYQRYQKDFVYTQANNNERTKLRLLHYGLSDSFEQIAADSENNKSGYRLKPVYVDMDQYKQAIRVMLTGGTSPDLIMTWAGHKANYLVETGLIEQIDDIWMSKGFDELFPPVISSSLDHKGSKYALPLTHHVVGMFYNKKLFHQYDLAVPKTWGDLKSNCQKLKAAGITPLALGASEPWTAQFWFDYLLVYTAGWQYRERLLSGNASFTDAQVQKVFELWYELIDAGCFMKESWRYTNNDANDLLLEGKAAMVLNGSWVAGYFEHNSGWKGGEDFDVFAFPKLESTLPTTLVGVVDVLLIGKTGSVSFSKAFFMDASKAKIQELFGLDSGSLPASLVAKRDHYSPVLKKLAAEVISAEKEIYSFDLSAPPQIAEIGLDLFSAFIATPKDYKSLLQDADARMKLLNTTK